MFRVILSFILTLFLFTSIIGTANIMFDKSESSDSNITAQISEKKDNRLSIKEIESITSENNFYFTSSNALN